MRARIVATEEIVDFLGSSIEHGTSTWIDSKNIYHQGSLPIGGIEILEKEDINWEQRRYELAKAAMQGMLSDSKWKQTSSYEYHRECVIDESLYYANAMIRELKIEKPIS